jgi:hypothetical protein
MYRHVDFYRKKFRHGSHSWKNRVWSK